MVFQDPMTSLNPLMPVGKQIMEGMIWHYHTPKEEAYKKALELMKLVASPTRRSESKTIRTSSPVVCARESSLRSHWRAIRSF